MTIIFYKYSVIFFTIYLTHSLISMLILDLYINAFRFALIYVNYKILFYLFYFNFTQQLMKNPIAIF